MRLHDRGRPSLDPVEIARRRGPEALFALLRDSGAYLAPDRLLRRITKSLRDEWPLMLDGERGGGKTAAPEALAAACNLPHFFFACRAGTTDEEMLGSWDTAVQEQHVRQLLLAGVEREQAQKEQWTLPFLNLGEIGAAYHFASESRVRCVLTIDEVDKLDERREDALLQVLARGFFDAPRLQPDSRIGSVPRADGTRPPLPIVFLTSNEMRGGTSSPLRSRCYRTTVKHPSQLEQIAILRVRVPHAPPSLVVQVVKMITYIRSMTGVVEKPAVREMIALAQSLLRDGVRHISREVIDDALIVICKRDKDEEAISERMSTIEEIVAMREPEIDGMVARVYGVGVEELAPPALPPAPTRARAQMPA